MKNENRDACKKCSECYPHREDLKSLRGEAEGSISQREMGMMIKDVVVM